MAKIFRLNEFSFFVDGDRADIQIHDSRDKIWCSIEEARNVYRAVQKGRLHTSEDVRGFLAHEDLFEEYDKTQDADTVCVIMIRRDATAYVVTYTRNEWMCGKMLGRDLGYIKRCSDGKIRNFDHE